MAKPAYFIFDVKVTDPAGMVPYQEKVAATQEAYGAEVLVLGGETKTLEGDIPNGTLVMLKFESMDVAEAWYQSPEYQEILAYREAAAESTAWLVEGLGA